MSDFEPFYDVSRSYEDNYEQGPFGAFAEALKDGNGADAAGTTSEGASEGALATFWASRSTCLSAFPQARCSTAVSPRPLSTWVSIWRPTKPCVRAPCGCNLFPNVLAVHPKSADGSLTPGSAELDEGVLADTNYEQPISISNSFGVPRRALTSGSRTCAPPSRPPVPVKCWSRASKARVWRA